MELGTAEDGCADCCIGRADCIGGAGGLLARVLEVSFKGGVEDGIVAGDFNEAVVLEEVVLPLLDEDDTLATDVAAEEVGGVPRTE